MSPEAQRIAIAMSLGWDEESARRGFKTITREQDGYTYSQISTKLPNYLNDLNAMHEAEKMLTNQQKEKYLDILSDFTEGRRDTSYVWHDTVFATSTQRAEAYLRTIGKWEGGSDE